MRLRAAGGPLQIADHQGGLESVKTTAQPPAAPGASPSTTRNSSRAPPSVTTRKTSTTLLATNVVHACRALIHDRSQCPTPLRARGPSRPAGSLTPSPGPPGLAPQPLIDQRKAHRTYFLLNNALVVPVCCERGLAFKNFTIQAPLTADWLGLALQMAQLLNNKAVNGCWRGLVGPRHCAHTQGTGLGAQESVSLAG